MTNLYLVRIALDARAFAAFTIAEGVDDDDRGYAAHLALRRRYGEAAPQPFRLFGERSGAPYLLGYAEDPAALDEVARLPATDPRLASVFVGMPESRPMPERWRAGARYGFDVRVRPVVRYGTRRRTERGAAGWLGGGERDAFLAAIEQAGDHSVDRASVYGAWLRRRLEGIVGIEDLSLRTMRQLRVRRSRHGSPGRKRIEGYEAVFGGTLSIGDCEAFGRLLARGIGRHAAFGFGMLLLAPPRPRGIGMRCSDDSIEEGNL